MDQNKLEAAVGTHILYNMSKQVIRELEAQTFVADDIGWATNRQDTDGDDITIYEWWLVTRDFAYAARNMDKVIVETPFGTIWGRQTTGQRISQDFNVKDILKAMNEI